MYLLREKNAHLRAKPSLPDLKQQSTASANRLNPLDLARVPAAHVPFLRPTSPVPSPRLRQASLPLTPPLTPSSSLDGTRTIPEPSTPTDSEASAPAAVKGDTDTDILHQAPSLARMPQVFARYLNRNAIPSRFLLIANLPKNATLDKITTLFSGPSGAFKGIWAGKLATQGVLVLIYFNIKEAELAYERYARGALVRDEMLTESFVARDAVRSLRVGYLGLAEAKEVTFTGKPVSPVTEIEAEAVFFVHLLAPNEERVASLHAALERFGSIFAMEPRGWEAGGEWMYVEFFDARDSVMALHNAEQITSQQNLHVTFRPNQPGIDIPFLRAQRPPSPPMFALPPPPARMMSPYFGDNLALPMPFGFGPPPTPFFSHAPPPLSFFPVPPPTPFHPPQFAPAQPFNAMPPSATAAPDFSGPAVTPPMSACSFPPSPRSPTTRPLPPSANSPTRRVRASLNTGASHIPPPENTLDLAKIERGRDMRTTVMIKNIPNKINDRELLEFVHAVVPRKVDFFYLRMDFQNGCNVGYAFVNFITVDDLLHFAKAKLGVKWNMYSSEKVLQMSYANYQGKEALVEKFKNSGIMDEREAWRPKIFHSAGPLAGMPEPFPAATHQRRKERSAHNRGALYVPGILHRS